MFKFTLILSLLFFLSSCGADKSLAKPDLSLKTAEDNKIKETEKPKAEEKKEIIDKQIFSVMPYDLGDIDLEKLKPEVVDNTKNETILINGFRIQVFVLSDFSRAKEFEAILNDQLKDTEHIVFSDFYSPNYRIRIGAFETRDEARKVLPMIKELGYADAFIVPDKVRIQKKVSIKN